MIFILFYSLMSGICVTVGTTGLLTQKLSIKKRIGLVLYVTGMAVFANMYMGQIVGIAMILILLILIYCFVDESKILNVFMAALGYLISMAGNNLALYLANEIFGLTTAVIIEKYWLPFDLGYAVVLWAVLHVISTFLYKRIHIQNFFSNIPKTTQRALVGNLILYIIIFLINISLGERTGYAPEAIMFNCFLFVVAMLVNGKILLECTKGIENEERRKAEAQQLEIMENYVFSLEQMVNEMRAFRHDYRNIMSTMAGYMRENQLDELKEYFYNQLEQPIGDSEMQMEAWKYLRNIQPMELKGFLYEKLLVILSRNIKIQVRVPSNMEIVYSDIHKLIRILGIYIDNAIEEAGKMAKGEIHISMDYTEKGVFFEIANNYEDKPDIVRFGEAGYSTKGDGRGQGLAWVDKTLKESRALAHELQLTDALVVQKLEIFYD